MQDSIFNLIKIFLKFNLLKNIQFFFFQIVKQYFHSGKILIMHKILIKKVSFQWYTIEFDNENILLHNTIYVDFHFH